MKRALFITTIVILMVSLSVSASHSAQTITSVKGNEAPVIDGSGNDAAWKSSRSYTVRDNRADVDVTIRSVYTEDEIFFLVQYPDSAEDRLHKPWVWNSELEVYSIGHQREDTFTFKWNMEDREVDLSNFSDNQYTADIWYWKANRTDPAGYSDDKSHVLSSSPGKKARELTSKGGKKQYLMRIGDSGKSAQKKRLLTTYQGDVQDQYRSREPGGSRADIRAKGIWMNGYWTIEFSRKLDTGNTDDIQFAPSSGKKYQFGISIAGLYGEAIDRTKPHWYGQGRISEKLYHLGLGTLVVLIGIISSLGIFHVSRIEDKIFQIENRHRAQLLKVDTLLSEFVEIRGSLTSFVIEEETNVKPILDKILSLAQEAQPLVSEFHHESQQELMLEFISKLKEYRTAAVAYAQELALRRTGEGVRTWERVLLETEDQAHAIVSTIKKGVRDEITQQMTAVIARGKVSRRWSITFGFIGVLSGIAVAFLLQRALSRPVQTLVDISRSVSQGDLRVELPPVSRDEIGVLSRNIGEMVVSLQGIIHGIITASKEVDAASQSLNLYSKEVSEGSELQKSEVENVTSSVSEMDATMKNIHSQAEGLTTSLNESSSSAMEMTASISEISNIADVASREIESISAGLIQMNANMQEMAAFLNSLSSASQETAATSEEQASTSKEVGRVSQESRNLAEEVTKMTKEKGAPVLEEMISVIKRNKELVDEYSDVITSLSNRSENIGEILNVIRDVADQTGILSLNAAIIAAQAGEHGRGFAVVSDEIRNLSSTTFNNVSEIEQVIQSVRREVGEAVKLIRELKKGADLNISSANNVQEVLQQIDGLSLRSAEMAHQISDSASLQAKSSGEIMKVVSENAQQVIRIKEVIDEQKKSSDHIVSSLEELREIARTLKIGTEEQAKGSGIISKTITDTHHFSEEIMKAMSEEQASSKHVVNSMIKISEVTGSNLEAVRSLNGVVNELSSLSERLANEMASFKLPQIEEPSPRDAESS
jgi:methyl-accepting chemotaxis protein